MNHLAPAASHAPAVIAAAGVRASYRFLEFVTARSGTRVRAAPLHEQRQSFFDSMTAGIASSRR